MTFDIILLYSAIPVVIYTDLPKQSVFSKKTKINQVSIV